MDQPFTGEIDFEPEDSISNAGEILNRMKHSEIFNELSLFLRPPGQGIHTVTAGKAKLLKATKKYLEGTWNPDVPWRDHLEKISSLKGEDAIALLAVPCDTGASLTRGANRGPEAIRKQLGKAPVFDLGDVFVVPQFLSDDMLSLDQIKRTQDEIYPSVSESMRRELPVSPLEMTTRVYQLVKKLNPDLRLILLGGDHSVSWGAIRGLLGDDIESNRDVGMIHFDAHTDLLPHRLGVKICYATWAYYANELIGASGRLLQIGVRVSNQDQKHWEETLGVKQIWSSEALRLTPDGLAEKVVKHLKQKNVQRLYLTNDLDATDVQWASACGTPEPNGLTREHVLAVIQKLSEMKIQIIGADVVELAPGLSLDQGASQTSVETAVMYLKETLRLMKSNQR